MKKYKLIYPLKRATDKWAITGKYYIVDGTLYIEMSSLEDMGLHRDMFEKIKKLHPQYKRYHYLHFPRGAVMFDNVSRRTNLSGPEDLDERQRLRIGRSFEAFKIDWEYDEHYNWPYIELDITLANEAGSFGPEILAEEIAFVKEHFYKQIAMFDGTKKAIFI